jgi:NTP pyrophosphatase (non-canonical NTP hydrolase)
MAKTNKKYTLDQYQEDAMKFRMESANALYALLNLSGEVGELHSLIAKGIRDGRREDFQEQFVKEAGDILWEISAVVADHGYTMEYIAIKNIEKLAARKEQGTLAGSGDNR